MYSTIVMVMHVERGRHSFWMIQAFPKPKHDWAQRNETTPIFSPRCYGISFVLPGPSGFDSLIILLYSKTLMMVKGGEGWRMVKDGEGWWRVLTLKTCHGPVESWNIAWKFWVSALSSLLSSRLWLNTTCSQESAMAQTHTVKLHEWACRVLPSRVSTKMIRTEHISLDAWFEPPASPKDWLYRPCACLIDHGLCVDVEGVQAHPSPASSLDHIATDWKKMICTRRTILARC